MYNFLKLWCRLKVSSWESIWKMTQTDSAFIDDKVVLFFKWYNIFSKNTYCILNLQTENSPTKYITTISLALSSWNISSIYLTIAVIDFLKKPLKKSFFQTSFQIDIVTLSLCASFFWIISLKFFTPWDSKHIILQMHMVLAFEYFHSCLIWLFVSLIQMFLRYPDNLPCVLFWLSPIPFHPTVLIRTL